MTFLNGEQPYSRRQRVRELMSHLTDEEISEFALPRVTKVVPPVDFFFTKEALYRHRNDPHHRNDLRQRNDPQSPPK